MSDLITEIKTLDQLLQREPSLIRIIEIVSGARSGAGMAYHAITIEDYDGNYNTESDDTLDGALRKSFAALNSQYKDKILKPRKSVDEYRSELIATLSEAKRHIDAWSDDYGDEDVEVIGRMLDAVLHNAK